MSHIDLSKQEGHGIQKLFSFSPKSAKPLLDLTQTILVEEGSLPRWFREVIASFVSDQNECQFCFMSHQSVAFALLDEKEIQKEVERNVMWQNLILIAQSVTKKDRRMLPEMDTLINIAKESGATDQQIHDTVLIASAFNMYNRYVDGMGLSDSVQDEKIFKGMGKRLAEHGYTR